jgi:hypothetical protein
VRLVTYTNEADRLIHDIRVALGVAFLRGEVVRCIVLTEAEYDVYRRYVTVVNPGTSLPQGPRKGPLRLDDVPVIREGERYPSE